MSHLDGHTVIPVEPVNHSQKELPPTMLITLEHASIGHPITRSGVSLFPVFIRQTGQVITTGPSVGVQITERAFDVLRLGAVFFAGVTHRFEQLVQELLGV